MAEFLVLKRKGPPLEIPPPDLPGEGGEILHRLREGPGDPLAQDHRQRHSRENDAAEDQIHPPGKGLDRRHIHVAHNIGIRLGGILYGGDQIGPAVQNHGFFPDRLVERMFGREVFAQFLPDLRISVPRLPDRAGSAPVQHHGAAPDAGDPVLSAVEFPAPSAGFPVRFPMDPTPPV